MVVSARDATGRVVLAAVSTWREVFVNGAPTTVGYLGGLRIDPRHRGRGLLQRGFTLVHGEHARRPALLFLTSIIEDNLLGRRALEGDRPGLPRFAPLGGWGTLTFAPRGDPWRARAVGTSRWRRPAGPTSSRCWPSCGPRGRGGSSSPITRSMSSAPRSGGCAASLPRTCWWRARVGGWSARSASGTSGRSGRWWWPATRGRWRWPGRSTTPSPRPPGGRGCHRRAASSTCGSGRCSASSGDRPEVLAALLSAAWRTMQARQPGGAPLHRRPRARPAHLHLLTSGAPPGLAQPALRPALAGRGGRLRRARRALSLPGARFALIGGDHLGSSGPSDTQGCHKLTHPSTLVGGEAPPTTVTSQG